MSAVKKSVLIVDEALGDYFDDIPFELHEYF